MMKNGQIIVAAVFVLVIVAILGMIAASMISTESFSVFKNLHGIQALNVAEGGIRFTVATSLAADSDWSDNVDFGPISLNPGVFSVHYVTKAKRSCVLEVTGTVGKTSRVVRASFRKAGILPSQFSEYAMYTGTPGSLGQKLDFYDSPKIIGNFYYYGPIDMRWVSGRPVHTQGVIKSTSILPTPATGVPTFYASWEAISTVEPITWDNSYYDNWFTIANRWAATSLNTGSNINLNGGTYWYRSVNLWGNAVITGPGTICATANPSGSGDINISNNVRFQGGPVRLVARDDIAIWNNVGTTYTATMEILARDQLQIQHTQIPNFGSTVYARHSGTNALRLYGIANIAGNIFAPYGGIILYNNSQVRGLTYANSFQARDSATVEGGSVFLTSGDIMNYVQIIQNSGLLPSIPPPGISQEGGGIGSFEVSDWSEVY